MENNREQLNFILEEIELFIQGKISFPQFVSDYGIALDSVTDIEKDKYEEFKSIWRALEEVNALSLDKNSVAPLEEYVDLTNSMLKKLKKLINE